MTAPKYPTEHYPNGCPCLRCLRKTGEAWKPIYCPDCGNDNCWGAIEHGYHGSTERPPTTEQRRLNAIRDYANTLTDPHITTHLTDILDGKYDDD